MQRFVSKSLISLTTRYFSQVTFKVKLIEDEYSTQEYTIVASEGTKLLTAIKDEGIEIRSLCGGHCKCGTCIVKVSPTLDGKLVISDIEKKRLDVIGKMVPQYHLACQTMITKDINGESIEINNSDI